MNKPSATEPLDLATKLAHAWEAKDDVVKRARANPIPMWAVQFIEDSKNQVFADILKPFNGQLSMQDITDSIKRKHGIYAGRSLIGKVLRGEVEVKRWGPVRNARFLAIKEALEEIATFVAEQEAEAKRQATKERLGRYVKGETPID